MKRWALASVKQWGQTGIIGAILMGITAGLIGSRHLAADGAPGQLAVGAGSPKGGTALQ